MTTVYYNTYVPADDSSYQYLEPKVEVPPLRTGAVNHIATCILSQEEMNEYCLEEPYPLESHLIQHQLFCDTPLHIACSSGNITGAKQLLSNRFGMDMINIVNHYGFTPLQTAFHYKSRECAKLLIEINADRFITYEQKWWFINFSCKEDWSDVLEAILKKSPKSILHSDAGYELLVSTMVARNFDCSTVMINYGVNYKPELFQIACFNGWISIAMKILGNIQNFHFPMTDKILFCTLSYGHKECAKFLINNCIGTHFMASDGTTPLHLACRNNWDDIAELLIIAKVNPDVATTDGYTPILEAVKRRHIECTSILINAEANFNVVDENGWSPIHFAIQYGWHGAVECMSQKAFLNISTNAGDTLLILACANMQQEIALYFIRKGIDVPKANNQGWTALHFAARNGWKDVAHEILVQTQELNISTNDEMKYTPLTLAIMSGHENLAKIFVGKDANLSIKDKNGWTVIHHASKKGMVSLSEFIAKRKTVFNEIFDSPDTDGITPLLIAAKHGHAGQVKLLIKKGANKHKIDSDGWSSIHYIAKFGWLDILELVVDTTCTISLLTNDKETPLHIAITHGKIECALLLVARKEGLNITNKDGNSALHLSCMRNLSDITKLLLDNKCKTDNKNKDGCTPLHISITNRDELSSKLLIDHNANLTVLNNERHTPLHIACKNGLLSVVVELIKKKVELNGQDKFGFTPLVLAIMYGFVDVAKLLIDSNADITTSKHKGIYPIQAACRIGQEETVRTLIEKKANINVLDLYGHDLLHSSIIGRSHVCTELLMAAGSVANDRPNGLRDSHFSLLLRNLDIPFFRDLAIKILPLSDIKKADSLGNRPLHYACYHKDQELQNLIMSKLDPIDFTHKNIYNEMPVMYANFPDLKQFTDVDNPLEIAFLKMDIAKALELKNEISSERFEEYVNKIKSKYNLSTNDFFDDLHCDCIVSTDHINFEIPEIPEKNSDIDISWYLQIYNTKQNALSEKYRNRAGLSSLIEKIKTGTTYEASIARVYKRIESALSHVLNHLQEDKRLEVITELLSNVNSSTRKIASLSYRLYYKHCLKRDLNFASNIYLKLDEIREDIVSASISHLPKTLYDPKLIDLILSSLLTSNMSANDIIDMERMKIGVFRRYTAYFIACELQKRFKEESELRDSFIAFLDAQNFDINNEWSDTFYEIVSSRGSQDHEMTTTYKQIIQVLEPIEEVQWDNILENKKQVFLKYLTITIELPIIFDVLKDLKIIL